MSPRRYTTRHLPTGGLCYMPNLPDAIILCGGAGVRLRDITGTGPKVMAKVAGRPFLQLLLMQLRRHGFPRAILAVGYRQEAIRSYFGGRALGLELAYSAESSPLGTGGALRQAADLVESDIVLVMNGDSYTDAELPQLVADHRELKADVSVVLVPANGRNDGGLVQVGPDGKLARFEEKQSQSVEGYLNAGIYMMSRRCLHELPHGFQVSLEQELLPRWIGEGKDLRAFFCSGKCVDIGTPARYQSAQTLLANSEIETSAPRGETRT
jgi:NDP-sugar pyrophosphorylase family protein